MSETKRKVEMLKHDRDKRYVELEVDGEKVKVEKFMNEEWVELHERERRENLSIEFIYTGDVYFGKEVELRGSVAKLPEDEKIVAQRVALAAYRLLWYFGPPLNTVELSSAFTFGVRYKGFIFHICDDVEHQCLRIDSVHLIQKEAAFGRERYKYAPPREIEEEILSIVKYLVETPVNVWADNYFVLV